MKTLPAPDVLLRQWLHDPHALTAAAFALSMLFLFIAGWLIQRNLLHNEPGLRLPLALPFALVVSGFGVFGASRLPSPWGYIAGGILCALAGGLFYYADHRRYVRDLAGTVVADRWQIVLAFAGFRWTRDKANRHFFFSGDTGSGKTSGMNGLLADLIRRNPTLGGVVMANKGDEWFYLEWLAKKHGREHDIIRLRPRLVGEPGKVTHRLNVTGDARLPFTTRARILVDTAAALNPRDEKGFFKVKGAAHIGRAFELLADIGRPTTATNAYDLLTSERELKAALEKLTELEPTERRIRLAETLEQTYLKHEAKEQRAGEIGTSQNYLEYLGTAEIAEIFSSNEPDTCTMADVDKGKIFCIDVPQDYTTERQYVFTVMKLLLYRHALRRYALPPHQKYLRAWVGCWAHVRRKFVDAQAENPKATRVALKLIARLYRLEREWDEREPGPRDHAARARLRQRHFARTLRWLYALALSQRERCRPRSLLGEACGYVLSQWAPLTRHVDHGQTRLDNNLVENAIRPSAIGKKNWLFIGHPDAGQRTAILYSLIISCQRHGIEPLAYLRDVLSRLPAMTNQDDLGTLTPSRWQPASSR